ncbi:MAG: response regulator [Gaiellales bacterium]
MSSAPPHVLVVDDERPIRRALELTLEQAGYRVATAGTARAALTAAALDPPDLVLLDMMLPDGDGVAVLRELRDWLSAPVLLVSVVDDEQEKVRALDAGADDYMTKPFGVEELLARVRALLRRGRDNPSGRTVVDVPPFQIDLVRRLVTARGEDVALTPTEFELFKALALADGRPLTHGALLGQVWGPGYATESQLLRVHMARLRGKLEAQGAPHNLIQTMTGVGYRLRSAAGLTDAKTPGA